MAEFPVQWLSLAILITNVVQLAVTLILSRRRKRR